MYTYLSCDPKFYFYTDDIPGSQKVSPCVPTEGPMAETTPEGSSIWKNPARLGWPPCVNGTQTFTPGVVGLWDVPLSARDTSVQGRFRAPANLHLGILALAQKVGAPTGSSPPTRTGGNLDNRRIGMGATMYYPGKLDRAVVSNNPKTHAVRGHRLSDRAASSWYGRSVAAQPALSAPKGGPPWHLSPRAFVCSGRPDASLQM